MTSAEVFDHAAGISSIISAVAALVAAIGTFINNRSTIKNREIGERSVAASERNSEAIAGVQDTLHNGIGQQIAEKAIEHIVPVLKEQADTAAQAVMAAAEKLATGWDGTERRSGKPDRRG